MAALVASLADAQPLPWSFEAVRDDIIAGLLRFFGDLEVEQGRPAWRFYPGPVDGAMYALRDLITLHELGALEPGWTWRDSVPGTIWLVQPTSPRINFIEVAERMGLESIGYLPPSYLDVPDRLILAWRRGAEVTEHAIDRQLADSKWVHGVHKVRWDRDASPLADPAFDVIRVLGDRFKPDDFRHSSELPHWPPGPEHVVREMLGQEVVLAGL